MDTGKSGVRIPHQILLNFFKINILSDLRRVGTGAVAGCFAGMIPGCGARTLRCLSAGLTIHLIELLTHMTGGPENRDQEPGKQTVDEIKKNG